MGLLWGGSSLGAGLALVLFAACAGTDTPPHADIENSLETAYGDGAGKAGSASMSAAGAAGSSSTGNAGAAGTATGAGGTGSGAAGSGSTVGNAGSSSVGTAGSAPVGSAGAGSGGTAGGGSTATLSFNTDIWPIFNTTCGPCHVTAGYGGQNIGSTDKTAALADAKSFKDDILMDIMTGAMPLACGSSPPGSDGCVTAADFQKIQDWFNAGEPQ